MNNENELTAALATIEKCREIVGCPEGVELQGHLRQLAAENVGLKSFGDTLFDMYKGLEISGGGIHDEQSVVCQQAALDAAMSAFEEIETPVTDRIAAGIKADGATAAGDYLKQEAQHMPVVERLMMQDAAEICYGTAARLREGGNGE